MPGLIVEDSSTLLVNRIAEWGRTAEVAMPSDLAEDLSGLTERPASPALFSALCGGGGGDSA